MAAVGTGGGGNHGSREARRRRIAERGADRLAFITGHIQSLPSESEPSLSGSSSTCVPAQTTSDSIPHEDIISGSSFEDHESGTEARKQVGDEDTLHENDDKDINLLTAAANLLGLEKEPPNTSSPTQDPELLQQREQSSRRTPLTTGQIYSAISASENIRIICSLVVAVLVILSHIGFSILGFGTGGDIFRLQPVYLLLMTNICTVVTQHMMRRAKNSELKREQSIGAPAEGLLLVDQLGKSLEFALLLQHIIGVLFMDFSIYAVMLVCGFSIARILGL